MILLEKLLWGGAVGGLALTMPFSGVLPTWAKTIGLSSAVASSFGLVALESIGRDWRKYQAAQEAIDRAAIEFRYAQQDQMVERAAEIELAHAMKQWIVQNVPVEGWEHWFGAYGLNPIALPEIAAAREAIGLGAPPMQELESEVIPRPEVMQGSVVDAVMQEIEAGLDTDWFDQWGKRSGIVCGESKDGKSYLLVNVVLAQFLKQHTSPDGKLKAQVYICDPDYGSSHGDTPPNTWLDLPVGTVVYTGDRGMDAIFDAVMAVSKTVDDRAAETSIAIQNKQPKPQFEPVLLIVDEEPMVAACLTEDQLDRFVLAIANILRRGIKQNVTFKMGTQTLAVGGKGKGGTRLNMDMLRQIEMVILWRAAQVRENYANLGVRPEIIEEVLKQVLPLPKQMGNKRICVTHLDKQLQIAGIPTIAPVKVVDTTVEQEEVKSNPIAQYGSLQDFYVAMSDRLPAEFTDTELMSLYLQMAQTRVSQHQWQYMVQMLREAIANVRSQKKTD